jgi:signal transduction histidine kinase
MQLSDISATTAIPVQEMPRARPTRAPPASSAGAVGGRTMAGSAEAILLLAEDHERIAHGLNDVVVRRLFSAGLDLQAALALLGDHHVASKLERVLDELDLAIRDLRNTVFDRGAT